MEMRQAMAHVTADCLDPVKNCQKLLKMIEGKEVCRPLYLPLVDADDDMVFPSSQPSRTRDVPQELLNDRTFQRLAEDQNRNVCSLTDSSYSQPVCHFRTWFSQHM